MEMQERSRPSVERAAALLFQSWYAAQARQQIFELIERVRGCMAHGDSMPHVLRG